VLAGIERLKWRALTGSNRRPLRVPPDWNEDGAFRAWFDSLQQLALPEARDAGVPAISDRT
jgi:hypothetical protein